MSGAKEGTGQPHPEPPGTESGQVAKGRISSAVIPPWENQSRAPGTAKPPQRPRVMPPLPERQDDHDDVKGSPKDLFRAMGKTLILLPIVFLVVVGIGYLQYGRHFRSSEPERPAFIPAGMEELSYYESQIGRTLYPDETRQKPMGVIVRVKHDFVQNNTARNDMGTLGIKYKDYFYVVQDPEEAAYQYDYFCRWVPPEMLGDS